MPPTKEPNFKIDEFFQCLRFVMPNVWVIIESLLVDEETWNLQGKCAHKICYEKYKLIGNGIQANCIADELQIAAAWEYCT